MAKLSAARPVDKYVGTRIRLRRFELGMSQTALAQAIGVAFQQVQKYEKATNRVSPSRLADIGKALGVDPVYFFPPAQNGDAQNGDASVDTQDHLVDMMQSRAAIVLLRSFNAIRNEKLRNTIAALVQNIAAEDLAAADRPAGLPAPAAATPSQLAQLSGGRA